MSPFMQANIDILSMIAELRTGFTVGLFQLITLFGEELIPIGLICLIYWCMNKDIAYGMGFAFFSSGIIVQGMKIGFRIPRPWDLAPGFLAVASEQAKLHGSYSFPSGHTQTATSLFGTLGFVVKKRGWKIACFAIAVLVGLSRMVLGVHTPLDVMVAFGLTLIVAYMAFRWFCGGSGATAGRMAFLGLTVLALALFALAALLNASGAINDTYTVDSLKQAAAALGFAIGIYVERKYIKMEVKATFWVQVIKLVCGIVVTLAIKEGLKLLIGSSMLADAFRYFLLMVWITALYPCILTRVIPQRNL